MKIWGLFWFYIFYISTSDNDQQINYKQVLWCDIDAVNTGLFLNK